jgi:autotransporter-associated beta strand protein
MTKAGTGTLTLSAANTYTGGTTISAGTLQFAKTNAMPATGAVDVGTGTTLAVKAGGTDEFTSETNGAGSIGGLLSGVGGQGAAVNYTGNVSLGIDTANASGGTMTYAGAMTNVGTTLALQKLGANTLVLSGVNTYTGSTTISAGTLQIGNGGATGSLSTSSSITNNGTLAFNRFSAVTQGTDFASVISGSGAVTQSGTGALTLGLANTYDGVTTISASSVLNVGGNANALGSTNSGTTVISGGQLRLNGGITFAEEALTINGLGTGITSATRGALSSSTGGNNTWQGKITLGSASAINVRTGMSLTLDRVGVDNAIEASNLDLTLFGDGTGVLNVSDAIALGTGGLIVNLSGSAVANLNAANTHSGTTTLTAGTLALGHTNALQNSTLETSPVGFGGRALTFTVAGANTYNLGGLSGDLAINISNNTLSVGANNAHTTNTGILSGTGGLTKVGTGTLTLGNNQTYTGTTAVSGGTLNLSGGSLASTNYSVASTATLLISTSNEVLDTAAVTLSGGTIQRASGVSEVFGSLSVSGSGFLDYGTGATGTLSFGTYTPSALLSVQNFGQGNVLTFTSDLSSYLPSLQGGGFSSSQFSFDNGFTSNWNGSTFTITAIPEPSTLAAAAGLLALLLSPAGRRLLARPKTRSL